MYGNGFYSAQPPFVDSGHFSPQFDMFSGGLAMYMHPCSNPNMMDTNYMMMKNEVFPEFPARPVIQPTIRNTRGSRVSFPPYEEQGSRLPVLPVDEVERILREIEEESPQESCTIIPEPMEMCKKTNRKVPLHCWTSVPAFTVAGPVTTRDNKAHNAA
ncbi:unnamed protein product [Nippostrongylus brasiliensis]|uniref:Uncharacterized protein n=1 Tax=Nippostrongylus brasiliensis TaxID=27835 RepID=A0A0N4XZ27_NIPBR|nr:unnamed protein product [Nippostrongylus brasiliensis]